MRGGGKGNGFRIGSRARQGGTGGSGWPGSGQRSAGIGSSFRGGVARRSGNWRAGASGSGRRFTGVTSGSGNSWRKIAEGCWGACGLGGSWAAECERSAGRSGDKRKCWGRFRAELEDRLRSERVSLGKAHSEAVRGIESKAVEFYREDLKGSEKRAREAARSDGLLLRYGSRPVDWYRIYELKHSVSEERLEQVREIDGEQAYEKMSRAVEKASQEKARQERARQSRERRGPERDGPERDYGPSR